jgi:hypothetical protein
MIRQLEEEYYVDESGFAFIVKTGLDLSNLVDGEIMGVLKRPNDSVVSRSIPTARITDLNTGSVSFDIEANDFTMEGVYYIQVFVRDADTGLSRPSHAFSFNVRQSLVKDADSLFV